MSTYAKLLSLAMQESNIPEQDDFNDLNRPASGQHLREQEMSAEIRDQGILIAKLRLAEERSATLAAIVDSSDDAIISKDLNGFVTSWNAAAERIFGYTAGEMIGVSITKLIPVNRTEEESQILPKIRLGERVKHFETQRLRKDGSLVDVSLTISPIKDECGVIIGISKIARDMTDLIEAEKQSAMLSAIVNFSDDAIISKDLNSIVTSWNSAAERIFGYTAAEMIGESIVKLIPADRQQEEPEIIARLKLGNRVDHFETRRVTKYGKLIDVSLTISPVMDITGRIVGVSKIARDITDKKKEEQRKNDFIAIVSHELKTPLTSIQSYVQLALVKAKEQADFFTENMLTRAEIQTRKMTTMIQDFLNLSRLQEGKMTLNLSYFSLNELMDEIVNETLTLAPKHAIKYNRFQQSIVNGDREKLGHVLTNLLGNAVKYSGEGSAVEVICALKSDRVEVKVIDYGVGISLADQARLFERFYRVDNELQYHISGFGIGLYLVAEILQLHGSQIRVQSEVGKGSTFSFDLILDLGQ